MPVNIRQRLKNTLIDIANGSHEIDHRLEATRQLVDLLVAEEPKKRKGKKAKQSFLNLVGVRD